MTSKLVGKLGKLEVRMFERPAIITKLEAWFEAGKIETEAWNRTHKKLIKKIREVANDAENVSRKIGSC